MLVLPPILCVFAIRFLGGCQLDVSRSMKYLHSRSPPIIHRDLKSLNLLLAGEDGPVKLCDFGLVRWVALLVAH